LDGFKFHIVISLTTEGKKSLTHCRHILSKPDQEAISV